MSKGTKTVVSKCAAKKVAAKAAPKAAKPAVEKKAASVGGDNVVDDADEGRLARAVGAKEAEKCATADMQGDVVEGEEVAVVFGDMIDLKQGEYLFIVEGSV